MTKIVNLTPHEIKLNSGDAFPASGSVARVTCSFSPIVDGVCEQVFGEVENLPEPDGKTLFLVSALVLSALNGARRDVVAPATGHPECVRNDKGHIVSVPCFVR